MDIDNLRYTMNKLIYIYSLEFFYFPVQENVPLINIDIDNIEKLKSNLEPLLGQPGMSNFISSLKNYIYIYNINSCTDEFSDIYTSAIISIIISILMHQWASQNMNLWEKWRNGTSPDDLLILARYFRTDEQVLHRARTLWNYIIDMFSSKFDVNSAETQ